MPNVQEALDTTSMPTNPPRANKLVKLTVQEALDTTSMVLASYFSWFTP